MRHENIEHRRISLLIKPCSMFSWHRADAQKREAPLRAFTADYFPIALLRGFNKSGTITEYTMAVITLLIKRHASVAVISVS